MNASILKRQNDVMVVGAGDERQQRRFSNGEINRELTTLARQNGKLMHVPHVPMRTAVRAGAPERVAMQMTGHKTRSVFERYNIVSECDLVEAAKKLNVLPPAAPPPEGGSQASDRYGHNSGAVSPDRGARLRASL
jgi:hypothetical protein